MTRWLPIIGGILALGVVIVAFFGQRREAAEAERMTASLLEAAAGSPTELVDLDAVSALPTPVGRYLRHVLTDGQGRIRTARLEQEGTLRTDVESESWSPFTARHLAVPPARGFFWDARVDMPLGTHVRVLDGYHAGSGSGRVSVMSAFEVASEAGGPELNAGALHRYLAEAVWYPTALLPGSGLEWSPVDENTARATLTDGGTTVSLEFRFNDGGEVTGVYSEGRYRRDGDRYERIPWEGRFRDYQTRDGMRVPLHGEVGWYDEDGGLQVVWRGRITNFTYELSR